MCGLAGIVGSQLGAEDLRARLGAMQAALRHRGPDDQGLWLDPRPGTGLVHTRLAILDLSPAGHQPMGSPDDRFQIVFNGEIYNFRELRRQLERQGERFVSHSDTEVLLALYRRDGPDCVRHLAGMFAFAVWDARERTCFLARDPLAIKPLYFARTGGALVFASEMRAVLASGLVPRRLNGAALTPYFQWGSVPDPLTLVDGIEALPAGHSLLWHPERPAEPTRSYWQIRFPLESPGMSPAEGVSRVREALEESVRRHLVSDVPVGLFLSGGIDSSALLALARRVQADSLHTFSISFSDPAFDEGTVAARTARHFGAQHHEWRLEADEGRRMVHDFLDRVDRPTIDGFNTYCVSRHAREQGIKVVWSGLGGDELFGSYPSFERVPRLLRWHRRLGTLGPGRRVAGWGLQRGGGPSARLGQFLRGPGTPLSAYRAVRGIFTDVEAQLLAERYAGRGSAQTGRDAWRATEVEPPEAPDLRDQVSWLELTRYMRNQLLRDSDVMSMAWGLELRVPLVDSRLVDAVTSVPASQRLAPGKAMLLAAVPEVPEWVAGQPKRGFLFPFARWVEEEWREVFGKLEAECPVRLDRWYRKWAVFVLDDYVQRHGLQP